MSQAFLAFSLAAETQWRLPKRVDMPIYSTTAVFCVLYTTDLAAGGLQEDTRCWFSFFTEENASNSDEGCSGRRWVQRKCGDFQGFEVFYLVYRRKSHDGPLWKLPKSLNIVPYLWSVVQYYNSYFPLCKGTTRISKTTRFSMQLFLLIKLCISGNVLCPTVCL